MVARHTHSGHRRGTQSRVGSGRRRDDHSSYPRVLRAAVAGARCAADTCDMWELVAVALCAVAAFAQWRVGDFTSTRARTWLTRAILATLGLGVGLASMRAMQAMGDATVWFLIGFGVVHVPAALVLLLKGLRGEQPS